MPKAGSDLMAGTILCMKSKASCFSSASLPETATRRFEDGGRGQLSQCRRGADGMAGFSHLPEPTRSYRKIKMMGTPTLVTLSGGQTRNTVTTRAGASERRSVDDCGKKACLVSAKDTVSAANGSLTLLLLPMGQLCERAGYDQSVDCRGRCSVHGLDRMGIVET